MLVILLSAYHHALGRWRKAFAEDRNRHPAKYFRIANEVPTLLMVVILPLVPGIDLPLALTEPHSAFVVGLVAGGRRAGAGPAGRRRPNAAQINTVSCIVLGHR